MAPVDFRSALAAFDQADQLLRIPEEVCKDTELLPLFRLQLLGLPEPERRVMVFEEPRAVTGRAYDMPVVAGAYGVSQAVLTTGLGCRTRAEILDRVRVGIETPLDPTLTTAAPVHDEVLVESDLRRVGLDSLPIPVEEPGFSQVIRTGMPMITKDPVTGVRNVGTYNGFVRDRDRIVAGISEFHDARRVHWSGARQRGEDLPIAIVLGVTPSLMLASSMGVPYGVDELALSGGFDGRPVDLVACKTIPLEVPAAAEIVIEGYLSTSRLEPRLGFSEYPGHINLTDDPQPVMHVTAITHRRGAAFTPMLVGYPPSDTNTVWGLANAALRHHQLRDAGYPVQDVHFPQAGAGNDICVVQLEPGASVEVADLLYEVADLHRMAKFFIVVDDDIDITSWDSILWAMSYRVAPERDLIVTEGRIAALDPTEEHRQPGHPPSRVLVDATMKHPYPPIALPARTFMEQALARWDRLGLPPLHLGPTWHASPTDAWTADQQRLADLISAGEHLAVGRYSAVRGCDI